ncbi:MAG: antitoxin Xre/MbcA/ParS toxin-binding domain-containing protein [Pseudomonadota bacterium]
MSGKAATAWLDVSPHEAATTMSSVREVSSGLPLAVAERLSSAIAPGDAAFKYRFVPKPTYTRRKAKGPSAVLSGDESERVVRISRIWALAQAVWGAADPARRFMLSPHMLLDGQPPLDVALSGELGGKLVEEILGRLAHGTAA